MTTNSQSLRRRAWTFLIVLPMLALSACSTPRTQIEQQTPAPVVAAESKTTTEPATPAATLPVVTSGASEPTAVGVVVDPLRPEVPVNLDDRGAQEAARKDLWQRVRLGLAIPNLETDLVRNQEQWYASRPDYVQRMTSRGSRYLFHIVEEVERRGMPTELALLPFIESAFNPQAMSSAKASGMWQFMPATGKYFDLKQNLFRDDRRDVLASTRAALDYLQKLHRMFDDWHLALAAYNWGEGNVRRAIERNKQAGLPADYLSLKMPLETQNYVPKLQAVKNIITDPGRFNVTLPALENHPYFLAIPIERDIDVEVAAKLSGLTVDEFRTLNPQMNKPVILAAGTPQLLLPYDNANAFLHRLKVHKGPLTTWTAWVTPSTMRPEDVAKRLGMDASHLREVNRIPPRMVVKAGSTLLVTRGANKTEDVSEKVADHASMTLAADAPDKRRITIKVGTKDTLAGLAKRHKVSVAQVQQWNQLDTKSALKAGQSLVVFVPQKTTSSRPQAVRANTSTRKTAAASNKQRAATPSSKTKTAHVQSKTTSRVAKN